jgi:hypothetical protein
MDGRARCVSTANGADVGPSDDAGARADAGSDAGPGSLALVDVTHGSTASTDGTTVAIPPPGSAQEGYFVLMLIRCAGRAGSTLLNAEMNAIGHAQVDGGLVEALYRYAAADELSSASAYTMGCATTADWVLLVFEGDTSTGLWIGQNGVTAAPYQFTPATFTGAPTSPVIDVVATAAGVGSCAPTPTVSGYRDFGTWHIAPTTSAASSTPSLRIDCAVPAAPPDAWAISIVLLHGG